MDHEWFTHQLEANQQGWDWFSVQLENGSELMLFQLRNTGGGIDPYSSGTYIAADGRARHLERADFELQPLEYWKSPKTGARYPVRWKITVPSLAHRTRMPCGHSGAGTRAGTERQPGVLGRSGYLHRERARRRLSGNDRVRQGGEVVSVVRSALPVRRAGRVP